MLDWVLPHRCPGCGVTVDVAGTVCPSCWPSLRFIDAPLCPRCGTPFEVPTPAGTLCGACLASPPPWTAARSAFGYDGAVQAALIGFKHADRLDHGTFLTQSLLRAGADLLADPDVRLVPVPLHRRRLIGRGYNQAHLLAEALGRRCHRPVIANALLRVRATPSQQGLSRSQRLANVGRAFRLNPRVAPRLAGHPVVLVDDVWTTGATVTGCTLALNAGGVHDVRVLTVARVVGRPSHAI